MKRNQTTKLSILFSLFIALTACRGEDAETIPPGFTNPPKTEIVELSGKSFSEIMELKYDKAMLVCNLFSRIGSGENDKTTYLPHGRVTFDLKKEIQVPVELKVKARPTVILVDGKERVREVEATITIVAIDIVRIVLEDPAQKKTYKLDNSPKLTIDFTSQSKMSLDGVPESGSGTASPGQALYEQRRTNLLFERTVTDPNYTAIDQLDCTLETEIKPDYQNELIIFSN